MHGARPGLTQPATGKEQPLRAFDAVSLSGARIPTTAGVAVEHDAQFEIWRNGVRHAALAHVADFVDNHCVPQLAGTGIDVAADVLVQFVGGGKCLRSTFMYLGWLCGADEDDAALRASAGLELLHAFALLQDDVMDDSDMRRGLPAAHVQFGEWHRDHGLSGSRRRFGASAAILLSDLCLVWAEQMMRESGVSQDALARAWRRYDAMRIELAVGQFADVANDYGALPTLDAVLDVARRKSGREELIDALGGYGSAIGEAFQLRDDVLGVFGSPTVTGKPIGGDLAERKATSVVVAAHQMADTAIRRQFVELMNAEGLDEADIIRWRNLIVATGAVEWIEDMIAERVAAAQEHLSDNRIDDWVQSTLANMAAACTLRVT
jgi:geranylgeranyl diphosphate synthase type I